MPRRTMLLGVAVGFAACLCLVLTVACRAPIPEPGAFLRAYRAPGNCQDAAQAYCTALRAAGYDAQTVAVVGGSPPHMLVALRTPSGYRWLDPAWRIERADLTAWRVYILEDGSGGLTSTAPPNIR